MATSGTYTEHLNNLAVVSAALRKIGRLGDHETLADTDIRYTASVQALKLICKEYAAFGMPLWAIDQATIALSNFTTQAGITIGLSGATVTQVAPTRVIQVIRRDNTDPTNPQDQEMTIYEQDTYNFIPNKSGTGAPNFWTYYPHITSTVHPVRGTLKVWPLPDTTWQTNGSLIVRYQRPIQDVGTSTQDLEFPAEWQRAVVYALAYDIAPEYGIDINQRDRLRNDRDNLLLRAEAFGTEEGSYRIQPKKR
jgi:hypothetical protein